MLLIVLLVFLAVFAVAALLMSAAGGGASKATKQIRAKLEAVLKTSLFEKEEEEIVDIRKDDTFSSVPWMDRMLREIGAVANLRKVLAQANLKWTPGRLLVMSAAAYVLAAYLIYLRTRILAVSLLIALLFGAIPFIYVLVKRRRRFDKFEQGLPDTLDMMVSALRAGHSVVSALGFVASEAPDPIGRELRICFEEQNFGIEMRAALENLVDRVPLQDLRFVTTAMVIQKESGGNLAEVLDKTGQVIRDRFRLKQQIRVHTAQGRLTGWILSILPLGLGIVLYFINPANMRLLWTRPIGLKMIGAASVMTLIGALIIRKIVRIRV
jgi:tight adherence protein B